MKMNKNFRFINLLNHKNIPIIAGVSFLLASVTCFGAYTIRPGSQIQIPVNVVQNNRNYPEALGANEWPYVGSYSTGNRHNSRM